MVEDIDELDEDKGEARADVDKQNADELPNGAPADGAEPTSEQEDGAPAPAPSDSGTEAQQRAESKPVLPALLGPPVSASALGALGIGT